MLILALHSGIHDSSAALFDDYNVLAAVQEERLVRRKNQGGLPFASMKEVLDIAGINARDIDHVAFSRAEYPRRFFTHLPLRKRLGDRMNAVWAKEKTHDISLSMTKASARRPQDVIDVKALIASFGLKPDIGVSFYNHHLAHALPALFFTDWDNALLYTADGSGDNVNYSHTHFHNGTLTNLFGDDRWLHHEMIVDSLGRAYANVTEGIGFRPNRHEGKLTGLAAYGKPALLDDHLSHFSVDANGCINSDFSDYLVMRDYFREGAKSVPREDAACSIQDLLEQLIHRSILAILEKTGTRNLGLAGGVFANVKLNRLLAENSDIDEVFIVPPMGDEGLVIGGALHALLERDGMEEWLKNRYRLRNVYWGQDGCSAHDDTFDGITGLKRVSDTPVETAAQLLAEDKIVAIYTGRMEYGPRALGARSILASPAVRSINDSLNKRLHRTEFMPFAPVVCDRDATDVFDITSINRYASTFMTITCGVKEEWREKIPAVVHIDGTARPQIIEREDNALYYDILSSFKEKTGLPVLVNTSFNAHEEPIINTPQEAAKALTDGRIDYIVTNDGIYAA